MTLLNLSRSEELTIDTLNKLLGEQAVWSQETFGSDEIRGPEGVLKHLAKEAKEAADAWDWLVAQRAVFKDVDESVQERLKCFKTELADCFLLLLDAMRRSKILSFSELVKCAYDKLQVNKKRDWPKGISLTEPVEHIKDNMKRPTIVCLCGSTRFYDAFQNANYNETMAGKIVLTVGFYMRKQPVIVDGCMGEQSTTVAVASMPNCTTEEKRKLDLLHFEKIKLSDEVLILNVGGYVGDSTKREMLYAKELGKEIRLLEPVNYEWFNDGLNRQLVYNFQQLPHVVKQEIVNDMLGEDYIAYPVDDPTKLGEFFKLCQATKRLTELRLRIDYRNI